MMRSRKRSNLSRYPLVGCLLVVAGLGMANPAELLARETKEKICDDGKDQDGDGLSDDDEEAAGSRRKKPYRYRWPEEVHDEVLARLLELNAERAEEEAQSGAATPKKRSRKAKP